MTSVGMNLSSKDIKTEIKKRVLKVKELPILPTMFAHISMTLQNPEATKEEIAKAISFDPALSAKILKKVNSSSYGHIVSEPVSSVQYALVVLGLDILKELITSCTLFEITDTTMSALWKHSVGVSIASELVAIHAGFEDTEVFKVAGLLHDLGKIVSAVYVPELYKQVLSRVQNKDMSYYEAERALLGFGHERINFWLAEHWRLPGEVREGMAYHHKPLSAPHYTQVACIVHIADFLVRVFEFGSGGDDHVSYFEHKVLAQLQLKQSDLEHVMDDMVAAFMILSDELGMLL